MGTELVPETLYSNELARLCAREDYIELCRRESFKICNIYLCHTILSINISHLKKQNPDGLRDGEAILFHEK
jgi:hypothetical protein